MVAGGVTMRALLEKKTMDPKGVNNAAVEMKLAERNDELQELRRLCDEKQHEESTQRQENTRLQQALATVHDDAGTSAATATWRSVRAAWMCRCRHVLFHASSSAL